MISSIFGKTKPINFIITAVFMLVFFVWAQWFAPVAYGNTGRSPLLILNMLVLLGAVFIIDFIAKRNNLTKQNNYAILVFAVWVSAFPSVFKVTSLVLANFFILLSIRRLISIRTQKEIKYKIMDAALWICVATLCHSWAVLYFVLLYLVIAKYVWKDFKNWIIPWVSMVVVGVLFLTYALAAHNISWARAYFDFTLEIDHQGLKDPWLALPLAILMLLAMWSVLFYVVRGRSKSATKHASIVITIQSLFVALVIAIVSKLEEGSGLIYMFFPVSVLITLYIQGIKRRWLREGILWALVMLPVAVGVLRQLASYN